MAKSKADKKATDKPLAKDKEKANSGKTGNESKNAKIVNSAGNSKRDLLSKSLPKSALSKRSDVTDKTNGKQPVKNNLTGKEDFKKVIKVEKAKKSKKAEMVEKSAPVVKADKKATENALSVKAAMEKTKAKTVDKKEKTAVDNCDMKDKATDKTKNQPLALSGIGVKKNMSRPGLQISPGVMLLGKSSAQGESGKREEKKNSQKLSKKEITDIKQNLEEKRERLIILMRRELAEQRERAGNKAADEVDKAADAYDEDLSFEIAAANDQELREIQVALERIDSGTYGECEVCGCAISPSRLKILPSATTCVSCRGQEELQNRRDDSSMLFNILGGDEAESEAGEG